MHGGAWEQVLVPKTTESTWKQLRMSSNGQRWLKTHVDRWWQLRTAIICSNYIVGLENNEDSMKTCWWQWKMMKNSKNGWRHMKIVGNGQLKVVIGECKPVWQKNADFGKH